MDRLLFGVSGLPLGDGKRTFNYASGIEHLARIGLDAMELLFVRSVNVSDNNAADIVRARTEHGIFLSAHGSYYVNLNAADDGIRRKSLERLAAAAAALRKVGARKLVFHPGYYLGSDSETALAAISDNLRELSECAVECCLETTGKPTQFGTVEEIVRLCQRHGHCRICVDFAHVHARGNGALRGYDDFAAILEHIGRELGREALDDLHIHAGGIRYTPRGERSHLPLLESDFNYLEMLKALRDFGVKGCVIAEGPRVEHDALILKQAYRGL
jgi:deoxyribonuclease IV